MSSHAPVRYSLSAPSAAALASLSGPFDTGDVCFVAGLTDFTYDKASVAPVDNVNVIDGPAGVGRWLRGPAPASVGDAAPIPTSNLGIGNAATTYVKPTGVAATDDAAMAAAIAARAANGRTIATSGALAMSLPGYVEPGSVICADRGTSISSTIAIGDGHSDSPFWSHAGGAAATTTLSAACAESALVAPVVSSAGFAGNRFIIGTVNDCAHQYDCLGVGYIGSTDITVAGLYGGSSTLDGLTLILNVNATGARTLTLNRATNAANIAAMLAAILATWPELRRAKAGPARDGTGTHLVLTAASSIAIGAGTANALLGLSAPSEAIEADVPFATAWPSGCSVYVPMAPGDFSRIDLGGGKLSGTGGRACWLYGQRGTKFGNARVDSAFSVFGPDYDIAGRGNWLHDLWVNNVGTTSVGASIEGGEDGRIDSVHTYRFNAGIQVGGKNQMVLGSTSHGARTNCGLNLTTAGPNDPIAARQCQVFGGAYDGSSDGDGVQVSSNSWGNALVGVGANYNRWYGFRVFTGSTSPTTCGASQNTFVGCTARENAASGFGFAPDGDATSTDNAMVACATYRNAKYGIQLAGGRLTIDSFTSNEDGAHTAGGGGGIDISGTGARVVASKIKLRSGVVKYLWTGIGVLGTGAILTVNGGLIDMTGHVASTYAVVARSGATANVNDLEIVDGNNGLYVDATSRINVGPNCTCSSGTPVTVVAGGIITMVQTGGVKALAGAAGTTAMSFTDHYCTAIEIGNGSPISSGTQTLTALAPFIGQEFTVRNYNTAGSTTVVFGLTVPASTTWRIRCNSAGTWEHVQYA